MNRLQRWLLCRPVRRTRSTIRRLTIEALEDRVVPEGRPLPYPVIAAGSGAISSTVKLFDAETGNTLHTLNPFGVSLPGGVRVALADFTGDAYPDVVAAAGPGGGPHVKVYDGKNGGQIPGPLGSFFAYVPEFLGGVQVAAGDVTGDGVPDVITAADEGGGPHVKIFDGKTGGEFQSFFAFEPEFRGGVRLAVGHFTDGPTNQLVMAAGVGGGPRVRIIEVATQKVIPGPLGDFYAFDKSDRSGVFVATGDITADHRTDLVVGAGIGHTPDVKVFDGVSGALAASFLAFDKSYLGGRASRDSLCR